MRRALVAADVLGLLFAMLVVEGVLTATTNAGVIDARIETLLLIATLPCWIVVAKLYGLYDRDDERTDHSTTDEFGRVFHMVTVCTWLFWATCQITTVAHPTPSKLLLFWVAATLCVSFARSAARGLARRSLSYLQNTLVVGAGDVGQLIAAKALQHPEYGLNIVGLVDPDPKERRPDLEHIAFLDGLEEVPALIELLDVERVIVAFSGASSAEMLELVRVLKRHEVQIDIVPRLFESIGPRVGFHMVEGLLLLGLPPLRLSRSSALIKRSGDLILSAIGLLVLAPLLALIAILVKIDSPGPALYRHERVGRGGKSIEILKFRTMRREACRGENYGGSGAEDLFSELMANPELANEFGESYKLKADPRVTRVGRFLRRSSLDELPQLLNVVKGDISLVGPRAVTRDELPRYGEHVDDLLGIRPGITGYWQINGRSRLSYMDRVRLDLAYIGGWSPGLDLTILAKTLRVLLRRSDAG